MSVSYEIHSLICKLFPIEDIYHDCYTQICYNLPTTSALIALYTLKSFSCCVFFTSVVFFRLTLGLLFVLCLILIFLIINITFSVFHQCNYFFIHLELFSSLFLHKIFSNVYNHIYIWCYFLFLFISYSVMYIIIYVSGVLFLLNY